MVRAGGCRRRITARVSRKRGRTAWSFARPVASFEAMMSSREATAAVSSPTCTRDLRDRNASKLMPGGTWSNRKSIGTAVERMDSAGLRSLNRISARNASSERMARIRHPPQEIAALPIPRPHEAAKDQQEVARIRPGQCRSQPRKFRANAFAEFGLFFGAWASKLHVDMVDVPLWGVKATARRHAATTPLQWHIVRLSKHFEVH